MRAGEERTSLFVNDLVALFSKLVAMVCKEWNGCRGRTRTPIGVGLVVLCNAVRLLTCGN